MSGCGALGRWFVLIFSFILCACSRPTPSPKADPVVAHAVLGVWTYPLDGHAGFIREFRSNGSVRVWWPDGKLAAEGTFFIVDARTLGVQYPNRDTDVVRLVDTNLIEIQRVEYNGYHYRHGAVRASPELATEVRLR